MKKLLFLLSTCFLAHFSAQSQEIVPFPDLSEHYNFRNSGGQSIQEYPYAHLGTEYQKSLEILDREIAVIERKLSEAKGPGKNLMEKELEELQTERNILLEEAELQSDLLKLH